MVAQGSMNSLNPVMRVRTQIKMGLQDHGIKLSKSELEDRISALLATVGLAAECGEHVPARAQRRHEAARHHRHRHQPDAAR